MKKRRALTIPLLTLPLLLCVSSGIVMRGYWREQASRELILAIKANDTSRALDALRAHADPNVRDQGEKAPSLSAYLSKLWLQMRGVKPAALDVGHTALGLAVEHDNIILVEALLDRGAKDIGDTVVTAHGRFAPLLIFAVEQKDAAIVQALLQHRWNANTIGLLDYSALFYAVDKTTVKALLSYGANIHAKSWSGDTALDDALLFPTNPDTGVVDTLLDAGAGDAKAIILALDSNNKKALKRLFALGWTVNRVDTDGSTPLMYAVDSKEQLHLHAAILLIRQGANVNFQNSRGETALLLAAEGGGEPEMDALSPNVIRALLKRGAQVNVQDGTGQTPLMVAASHLRPVLVRLLLQHGAQVNIRTTKGETALSLARHSDGAMGDKASRSEVIRLLKEAGAKE